MFQFTGLVLIFAFMLAFLASFGYVAVDIIFIEGPRATLRPYIMRILSLLHILDYDTE